MKVAAQPQRKRNTGRLTIHTLFVANGFQPI